MGMSLGHEHLLKAARWASTDHHFWPARSFLREIVAALWHPLVRRYFPIIFGFPHEVHECCSHCRTLRLLVRFSKQCSNWFVGRICWSDVILKDGLAIFNMNHPILFLGARLISFGKTVKSSTTVQPPDPLARSMRARSANWAEQKRRLSSCHESAGFDG